MFSQSPIRGRQWDNAAVLGLCVRIKMGSLVKWQAQVLQSKIQTWVYAHA